MAKKKPRPKTKKTKAKTKTKKTNIKTAARAKPAKSKSTSKTKAKASKPKSAKPATATARAAASTIASLPDLEVETTSGGRLRLSDLKGKNLVLYFYPKDDTPGCTVEGCDIRDRYPDFQHQDTVVLGVSRDSLGSHEKFKAKFGFPFELISDPDEALCRAFNVMRKKSLYGREYMGIERSTFIFDKQGKLRKEFRGVKVDGHAIEILNEMNKL